MTFFPFFPGEDQFVKFLVRGCVAFWVRVGPVATNGLAAAVRRVFFSEFFGGSSFDTVCANLKRDLLKRPSLLFVFCSFLRLLLGFGVNTTLHVCFAAVGPKPFFSFCFFLCLFQKHCFSPWKRVIFVHFSVSPFLLSPWLHSRLLCLSLSLSLFLLFLIFPSLLFCFFWDLPCFFAVISCLVSLLLFHENNNNIKILDVKGFFSSNVFLNLLGFLFCFVFPIPFSYLCFSLFKFCVLVNMSVFIFLRRPFPKHWFCYCTLWSIIVFIGAHFVGKFWLMCKKAL